MVQKHRYNMLNGARDKRIHSLFVFMTGCIALTLVGMHGRNGIVSPARLDRPSFRVPYQARHMPSSSQYCNPPDPTESVPTVASSGVWYSSKQRQSDSVTIVTQASLSRLNAIRTQCTVWQDRIAAAIYVPLVSGVPRFEEVNEITQHASTLVDVVEQLAVFHAAMDMKANTCVLDLELIVEAFDSINDTNLYLYPFNTARNRALQLSQTDIVFLLDADFIPSTSLFKEYSTAAGYKSMLTKLATKRTAMVIPAFDSFNSTLEDLEFTLASVHKDRAYMVDAYRRGRIEGFTVQNYFYGHGPTNYSVWETTDKDYPVQYGLSYEPYIMMHRQYTPWYDERFRGYGYDKIVQLDTMVKLGTQLFVNPRHFVIHVPHEKAPTLDATKRHGHQIKLIRLIEKVRTQLITNSGYIPVTAFSDNPLLCRQLQEGEAGMQYIELPVADNAWIQRHNFKIKRP